MFKRFLIPLDGSRLAESVLPVAARLAALVSGTIQLVHVIEKAAPSSIHGDTHLQSAAQAESYLADIAGKLKASDLQVSVHVHSVPQGNVAQCIAEHADELHQDLIVLCTHGSGGMRRFMFGSNAEQVLAHGAIPVLLIQPDERGTVQPFGPKQILALLDNKPATRQVLTIGAELALIAQARLSLLSVIPTLSSVSGEQAATGRLVPQTTRHVLDLAAEEAANSLRDQVSRLTARGVDACGSIERGETAAQLVRVAHEVDADLVIIAALGLAGLSAFWADALTRKVAGTYSGALLLIPRSPSS